jgi:GT2 family glycosyltransferase
VGVVIMGCNLASRTAYANTMASLEQQVFRARYVMRVGQDTFRVSEVAQALDVDLVCFVRAGDTLEPDALITYVRGARDYPETCMWYSDTDILKKRTFIEPNIRPELSFEDMTSAVGWESGVCFRSDVLKAIVEASNHDHMGVYETVLAAYAQNMQFFHIERVLFHLKEIRKPKLEIEGAALTRYLAQVGIKAEVALVATGGLRLLYDTTGAGLVSIVVLSRNNAAHLRACIDSIKQQTPRMRYEIVVADWGAHGEELEAYYRELMHDTSVRLVALAPELTYAQAINAAVAASCGEYVLLLQQDLRVLNVDWLEALLGPLMRDEVGVTSAKILYPDGLVQHAGMQTTPGGDFVFVNQNLDKHDAGYMYTLQRNVAYSVVTGACQLIKRALFDELGGYDEGYATTMCEYEFCLKVRASGHTVVVVNDAVMEHELYDARNRHAQTEEEQIERFHDKSLCMAAHPAAFALGDPAQNRQLIPTSGYFALQW